jgi:hypothetical protein
MKRSALITVLMVIRRHQAASSYTEDQARLLFTIRDMVKAEVKRQLKEIINQLHK